MDLKVVSDGWRGPVVEELAEVVVVGGRVPAVGERGGADGGLEALVEDFAGEAEADDGVGLQVLLDLLKYLGREGEKRGRGVLLDQALVILND